MWSDKYGKIEVHKRVVNKGFHSIQASTLAVKEGDLVNILRRTKGWYKCEKNKMVGWVPFDCFE